MSEKERVYDLQFRLPDGRLVSGRFPGRVKQSDVVQALAQRYPDTVDDDMEIGSWPWWMTLADVAPKNGEVFEVQISSRGGYMQELYGCPTAVGPQQTMLADCRVEAIPLD